MFNKYGEEVFCSECNSNDIDECIGIANRYCLRCGNTWKHVEFISDTTKSPEKQEEELEEELQDVFVLNAEDSKYCKCCGRDGTEQEPLRPNLCTCPECGR